MTEQQRTDYVSTIAVPLAPEKLEKRIYKLIRKSAKNKGVRRGVKEVLKALRRDQVGICILAGDISPIDVITPIPALCEEKHVPYIYVASKQMLGVASLTKRPTSCVFLNAVDDENELIGKYKKIHGTVSNMQILL